MPEILCKSRRKSHRDGAGNATPALAQLTGGYCIDVTTPPAETVADGRDILSVGNRVDLTPVPIIPPGGIREAADFANAFGAAHPAARAATA